MADVTPLDMAHRAMSDDAENDTVRLRFYERLAESELFLMLKSEVAQDAENVEPEIFELETASYVLVFDREERLSAFAGQITPYVGLSGRTIATMLQGQNIGLGVNLDVAPSSILLPPEAMTWLTETLGHVPDEIEAGIAEVAQPAGLPERLIEALDTKLATAMGLATAAYLVAVTYKTGARGHLLAFVGSVPQAQTALTSAVAEALTFSGIEAGALDVCFVKAADPMTAKLDKVGLRFDLPQLQKAVTQTPQAPGTDPAKPPKLK